MNKLNVGDRVPEIVYETPFEKGVSLDDKVSGSKKTALIFLRYYGCPLCQYDMLQFAKKYSEIKQMSCELIVALQSDPIQLAEQLKGEHTFPYDVLCDPKQELYKQFDIDVAKSMAAMAGPSTMMKIAKVKLAGIEHGTNEGEELQLPAVFIMDQKRVLTYVRYGKKVDDIPTPEELVQLLQA